MQPDLSTVCLADLLDRPAQPHVEVKQEPPGALYIGLADIEGQGTGIARPRLLQSAFDTRGNKHRFKVGDILYGRLRPDLNKVWQADSDGICSNECLVLRGLPSSSPELVTYTVHFLRSAPVVEAATSLQRGTLLPRVGWNELQAFAMRRPPPRELRERVGFLNELGALRQKFAEQTEALRRLPAALMQRCLDELPAPADASLTLGELVQFLPGSQSPRSKDGAENGGASKPALPPGDLVVKKSVGEAGGSELARVPSPESAEKENMKGGFWLKLKPDSPYRSADFICAYLNSDVARSALQRRSSGGRSGLTPAILAALRVPQLSPDTVERWQSLFVRAAEALALALRRQRLLMELRNRIERRWFGSSVDARAALAPPEVAAPYRRRPVFPFLSNTQQAVLDTIYRWQTPAFSVRELQQRTQDELGATRRPPHREHLRGVLSVLATLGFLVPVEDDLRAERWRRASEADAAAADELDATKATL